MTTDPGKNEPGGPGEPGELSEPANLNAPAPPLVHEVVEEDIVSVNKKGSADNKAAKAVFLLVVGAVLVGGMAWFGQNWVNVRKAQMKADSGPKAKEDTAQVFNPEKTGSPVVKPKIGAESGLPAPSQAPVLTPPEPKDDTIRPVRGADGKVMVNPQGRAMGVDRDGNIVEVPAITAMTGDQGVRKPLPGQAQGQPGQGGQAQPKPSRYGGSLFVGEPAKASPTSAEQQPAAGGASNSAGGSNPIATRQAQQIADILRNAGLSGGAQAPRSTLATGGAVATAGAGAAGFVPPPEPTRPGTVGSALYSSSTPVAYARQMSDQNLILPKGRQADCVLTGRIVDEVPGFTSCVLAHNLYSDNGRVLLLERGSELTGEYGITNQLGLERLFVTWTRLKTPDGIEVDLSSPGSDRLGTSGVPGHLDNRWGARVGAAFLLSFVKDITVAIINKSAGSDSNATVNVQSSPGQNTMNATTSLAEEVIKQTIKVRPRLTVNEGDRISIYVARDLDFSPVYSLKSAGMTGHTRLLAK